MHRPEIPFSFLATQACRNCQLPVTCGPVYVVHNSNILCGRCRMIAEDRYRNYSYEALASVFLYPCQNWRNHCPAKLEWNDSLEHEPDCNYVGCCTFVFSHPGAFFKGKRDIPDDDIRLYLIPEDLLDYVKCAFCEGYLSCAPVFIQTNGQNVCHRCVNANGNPPNSRRNVAYEDFCKMFVFPCIFRNRGCSDSMPFGVTLWQHESQCEFGDHYEKKSLSSISPTEQIGQNVKKKEKGLITKISERSTPDIDFSRRPHIPPEDYDRRPEMDFSRKPYIPPEDYDRRPEMDFSRRPYIPPEDYDRKLDMDFSRRPYIPAEDYDRRPISLIHRPDSRESGYQTGPHQNRGYQDDMESDRGSETQRLSIRPRESYRETPVAGNFPILLPRHLKDGFGSISERYSKRESFRGNTLLISELKIKQDMIKRTHSIRGDQDLAKSPFKACNNLDDIKEVHRQLR